MRTRWRDWLTVGLTLALCTLACALLEPHMHPANMVMVFMAGVVFVASRAGRAPAVMTVAGSIFVYDLVFVPPRWSLKPTEPQYGFAFLVMLAVGLLISQLAARSREQALVAEARAQRTQALNQLSVALGSARDTTAVAQALGQAVHAATGAEVTVLCATAGRAWDEPRPPLPQGFDEALAQQALALRTTQTALTDPDGGPSLRYVPLVAGAVGYGVLVTGRPDPQHVSLEDQHLVEALASQAAVAMERAAFETKSIAAAIDAEVERTRNTLLAGISHDFRTPLTTIVGSATTLIEQAEALDEPHRIGLLQGLLSEAQRLHRLSSNLLELTRLDAGGMILKAEWCPADELVEEAVAPFSRLQLAPCLDVELEPDALVWCDPRLLGQALTNLLDNAIRHSPPQGRIGIRIETAPATWHLIVQDQGPGIPPGHEQSIFRKFYQAAGDGDSTGKGLGLAICAAVARLHAGSLRVTNNGGARFEMSLPQPALPELARTELT